eukprot:TRINITY_DN2415_c0_g1_i1.p1 TRINITY_DN2415_c0_g1~~TRINITY_DN2415_c0_g1_i1.p1  ORF type:complete len:311 (+),score=54.00 TRINITY_DN2415_c0_g1_i1:178-1110(+)
MSIILEKMLYNRALSEHVFEVMKVKQDFLSQFLAKSGHLRAGVMDDLYLRILVFKLRPSLLAFRSLATHAGSSVWSSLCELILNDLRRSRSKPLGLIEIFSCFGYLSDLEATLLEPNDKNDNARVVSMTRLVRLVECVNERTAKTEIIKKMFPLFEETLNVDQVEPFSYYLTSEHWHLINKIEFLRPDLAVLLASKWLFFLSQNDQLMIGNDDTYMEIIRTIRDIYREAGVLSEFERFLEQITSLTLVGSKPTLLQMIQAEMLVPVPPNVLKKQSHIASWIHVNIKRGKSQQILNPLLFNQAWEYVFENV